MLSGKEFQQTSVTEAAFTKAGAVLGKTLGGGPLNFPSPPLPFSLPLSLPFPLPPKLSLPSLFPLPLSSLPLSPSLPFPFS